jgi:hypothetical protein
VIRPALLLSLLLPAAADEVLLADGSKLSGTVTALADGGQLMLSSPLAFEPFQLKADRLKRVNFAAAGEFNDRDDALVVLANGDQFPGELSAIDGESVTVRTLFAGEIKIPRSSVNTIQLGVSPPKIVYRGPADDAGWEIKNGWRFDSMRFAAENSGTIFRKFDIPGSFLLRFRVSWRNTPNIQVYFADDSFETTGKADRYYLQFGGAGMELKRQQSNDGHPFLSMASIPGEPGDYPDNNVDVELRVDRKLGQVHLFLDGEEEGKFADPVKTRPTGQGIMFRSNIGGDDSQFIDNIEIREWDPSSDRHRTEERGDEKQDVLITRSSDRGTGSILGMVAGADGGTIRYKGPHHPDPVELSVSDVSTLFFAKPADAAEPAGQPLKLGLRGRGSLGVTGCVFTAESVTAKHPLLGDLTIRRDAIANLARAEPVPDAEADDEEEDKADEEEEDEDP